MLDAPMQLPSAAPTLSGLCTTAPCVPTHSPDPSDNPIAQQTVTDYLSNAAGGFEYEQVFDEPSDTEPCFAPAGS